MRAWQNGVTPEGVRSKAEPEGRRSPMELKEWRVEVQPKACKSMVREYKARVDPNG